MSDKKTIKTSTEKTPKTNKPSSQTKDSKPLDPVRYGDWEKNGRCIDF